MKNWLLGAAVAVVSLAMMVPADVEAKRLGGGKSSGMQRDMPARTAPDAPAGKPATPAQASPTAPAGAAATAGAAAAPAKRSWMGPLAGLAAGLGIAALLSHFGLGEGFANFLMLALLAVAAVFLVRWIMRRMSPAAATPNAMQRSSGSAGGAQVAWPSPGGSSAPGSTAGPVNESAPAGSAAVPAAQDPVVLGQTLAPVKPAVPKAFVPATFDAESFQRAAKMIFIRLQAANDAADLDDIRGFTTPEMFAELRMDIQDRNGAKQHTDVLKVDAEVLDVAQEAERQIVSVRYTGQLTEAAGEAPVEFNEVWHLVKPMDDSRSWAIAGIEQTGR